MLNHLTHGQFFNNPFKRVGEGSTVGILFRFMHLGMYFCDWCSLGERLADLAFPQWADFEPPSIFRASRREKGKEGDSEHRD